MPVSSQVAESILSELQLPIAATAAGEAITALTDWAATQGLSEGDVAIVVSADIINWTEKGSPPGALRDLVEAVLSGTKARLDSTGYFELHDKLTRQVGDVAALTHSVARRVMSRVPLIAHLLERERMSCSQVAWVLQATEPSLAVPFGSVEHIARMLGLLPSLDRQQAGPQLWAADQARALDLFPDSTIREACEIAGGEISKILPEADTTAQLKTLTRGSDNEVRAHIPYLQALHWCATALEFYDHRASYLYEFAPRGNVGNDLFANYNLSTGNPFLNNMKAVYALNHTWALSRGGLETDALVGLLADLESLPYSGRREVARIVRAWLWRVIELQRAEPDLLEIPSDESEFDALVEFVVSGNTATQGVLEQRVVDCLAVLTYPEVARWHPRGLGDSVNASNMSKRKLGDIEFTRTIDRDTAESVAIEAHGGHLSRAYVESHQKSLARILELRLSEGAAAAYRPGDWTVEVQFVAHSRDLTGLPEAELIHGVPVTFRYLDYAEFRDRALSQYSDSDYLGAFIEHVVYVLNRPTVRQLVRDRYREIVASR